MIFQHTWEKVLTGQKTQTSRIQKPGEELFMTDMCGGYIGVARNRRTVYKDGNTYAVQPGRNHPALLYCPDHPCFGIDIIQPGDDHYRLAQTGKWNYAGQGYKRARIRILEITPADVRTFGEAEINAEGFSSFAAFIKVWAKMHDPHAMTYWTSSCSAEYWQSCTRENPAHYTAWVLRFELV